MALLVLAWIKLISFYMSERRDIYARPVRPSHQVILSAADYDRLPHAIVHQLMQQADKPCGIRFVRSEDGCRVTDDDELLGALIRPLRVALGISEYKEQPSRSDGALIDAKAVFAKLLAHVEKNTCLHEETERGGASWEICTRCGKKWHDADGGKPANAHDWPDAIAAAQDLLTKWDTVNG